MILKKTDVLNSAGPAVLNGNTCTAPLSSGLKGSLQRMQLEYVDVVFANRPDSNTPMEGELFAAQQTSVKTGCHKNVPLSNSEEVR